MNKIVYMIAAIVLLGLSGALMLYSTHHQLLRPLAVFGVMIAVLLARKYQARRVKEIMVARSREQGGESA